MSWLGEVLHTTMCVVAMTDWVITAHDNPSGSCSINVSLASSRLETARGVAFSGVETF